MTDKNMRLHSFIMVVPCAAALLTSAAGAQPLVVESRSRSVSVNGQCCNVFFQGAAASETEPASVFSRTVTIGHEQNADDYCTALARQETTIRPRGIDGVLRAEATARGTTAWSEARSLAICTVAFTIAEPCGFRLSAAADQPWMHPGQCSLRRANMDFVAGGGIWNERRSFEVSGTLEAGGYVLVAEAGAWRDASIDLPVVLVGGFEFEFKLETQCPCDWDDTGALDSSDFFAFLECFFVGCE